MPVLTEREYMIAIIQIFDGTNAEKKTINEKLNSFQKKLVDQDHVDAVNAFIPAAEREAKIAEEKVLPHDKVSAFDAAFHKSMNNSTRKAGLRV